MMMIELPALRELKALPHWVAWQYEERNGKQTKAPINPCAHGYARSNDPKTWGTYKQAYDCAMLGKMPGVGFMLGNADYTGYDLDKCCNQKTGFIKPWAKEILVLAETYAEYSPSGKGIRLIARGKIEKSFSHRLSSVEVYRDGRYLTITENHIPGAPKTINPAPRTLAACRERVRRHSEIWNKLGWRWKAIAEGKNVPTKPIAAQPCALQHARAFARPGLAESDSLERIEEALQFINADDRDVWVKMGMAIRSHLGEDGYRIWDQWSRTSQKYDARDQQHKWRSFNGTGVSIGTLFHHAQKCEWRPREVRLLKAGKPLDGGSPSAGDKSGLRWLDMSNWDHEPLPVRQWAILDRVPLKQAGLFSGEGGVGKSLVEIMKDVAHVAGKDWFGSMPALGGAFYIGAEDDEKELHIRFATIAEHYGVSFKELIESGLKVMCLLGQDATLCAPMGKSGKVETTDLYRQLYEQAGDLKPINISIDTLSRAFAGSEIDRVQVYGFAMHMQALAMASGGSVTVLSHPSLQGIASGSGISGSTAWHGAFRFRQYLTGIKPDSGERPDDNLRELQFKKNQYGPLGETIVVRYQDGLYLPVAGMSSLDRAKEEAAAETAFLTTLRVLEGQNRYVSDKLCPTYAPKMFSVEPTAKGISKTALAAAMQRLFTQGAIRNVPYRREGQFRIALG
jgi:RecA-family ATPase